MQQAGVIVSVPHKAQRNSRGGFKIKKEAKYNRRSRTRNSASPSTDDAFAFLNETFGELTKSDSQLKKIYRLDAEGSYDNLRKCCERFLEYFGKKLEYKVEETDTYGFMLQKLIEEAERKVNDLGLSFFPVKRDEGKIDFVVYKEIEELEWTICIYYCNPANGMSEKGGVLYKKFISFLTRSLGIPAGIVENSDNERLDEILNWRMEEECEDEEEECEDEEERLYNNRRRFITKAYDLGGEYEKLFHEINRMAIQDGSVLKKELEDYRNVCPEEEIEIIECMMDGIAILPTMNIFHWDGVNQENYDSDNAYIILPYTTCVLFSQHDGIDEDLIEELSSEMNSGVEVINWNLQLTISKELKEEDIKGFYDGLDNGKKFSEWTYNFIDLTKKFDIYGTDK